MEHFLLKISLVDAVETDLLKLMFFVGKEYFFKKGTWIMFLMTSVYWRQFDVL